MSVSSGGFLLPLPPPPHTARRYLALLFGLVSVSVSMFAHLNHIATAQVVSRVCGHCGENAGEDGGGGG
ncbi:hypothetical protein TYRP_019735 [Tyrophagus putrescentiae]|nr:hypothetical protein TYRP_019735 [Tyrophagus putrescentiae]